MRNIDPFITEHIRDDLCRKRNLAEFRKTYASRYPEIKDLNTSKLWDDLNRRPFNKLDNPMAQDRLKIVSDLVGDGRVLDVGFGSGDLESVFFENFDKNVEWHGIDISLSSVKRAAERFPFAHFDAGSILSLKFENRSFDFVVALEVLEHIKPSRTFRALEELRRVLKPAGKLIVSVPLNEGLETMVKHGCNPNAHVRAYTPRIIKCELNASGFNVLQSWELFAFGSFYGIKTLIARFASGLKRPNNVIILAERVGGK